MNSYLKKSLTLIELLIAITLLSVIILAISNIDLFTYFHTISADRRVKVQNEVSYVLEHMTKEISKAIGDVNNPATNTTAISGGIGVYVDLASDGSAGDGRRGTGGDRWIGYRRSTNDFQYCSNCGSGVNPSCSSWDTLSGRITNFTRSVTDNYVDVSITARWQPAQAASSDNPEVTMRTKIKMPSVSTH